MSQDTDLVERFMSKVETGEGCWTWRGCRNPQGYGQFWDPERRTMGLAHRFSYEAFVGPLQHHRFVPGSSGDVVCHRCDNPPCVNPDHLFLGTQHDNMQDLITKGLFPDRAGAHNGRAKLTKADVDTIRASVTGKYGERSAIAREWGISTSQVSKILQGDVWAA